MKFNDNLLEKYRYTREECLEPNQTIQNLWSWARKLEIFGMIGAGAVLVFGAYISATASNAADALGTSSQYAKETVSGTLFLSSFVKWLFFAFLTYCSFHALALIISAVGNINYNTLVTAKVTLASAKWKEEDEFDSDLYEAGQSIKARASSARPVKRGFWICPDCSRRNDLNQEVCACGKERSMI